MSWILPEVRLPPGRVRNIRPLDMRGSGATEKTEQPETVAERAPDRAPMPVTTPSPARPAVTQEEPMKETKPVRERVLDVLKEHGACTLEQLARLANTTVGTLYTMMGTLKKKDGVVKDGLPGKPATYSLGGKKAEVKAPKAAQRKAPRAAPAAQPVRTNGHAAFAINEDGQLGLEKSGTKLTLDGEEFERLRAFIERTEPVWKGAGA